MKPQLSRALIELRSLPESRADLGPARRLLELVRSEPGLTIREAGLGVGQGHRATMRHANALTTEGKLLLTQGSWGNHLFPYEAGLDRCWRQVVALRDEPTNDLYRFTWIQGHCREQELVDRGRVWGAPRGFVRHRISILVGAQLIEAVPVPLGRSRIAYRALPIQAPALSVLMSRPNQQPLPSSPGTISATQPN